MWRYSDMVPTPRFVASRGIVSASRPSSSTRASAAATITARDRVLRGTRPEGWLVVARLRSGTRSLPSGLRILYASVSVCHTQTHRGDEDVTWNVKRVDRFSTGTVDIHPQHAYRGRSPMYWWVLTSRRGVPESPIHASGNQAAARPL